MDNLGQQGEDFNNSLNKTLHIMTAHLHRYGYELGRFADIVEHVKRQYEEFCSHTRRDGAVALGTLSNQLILSVINQLNSQLQDVDAFRQELEHKTQNILALVCRRQFHSCETVLTSNSSSTRSKCRIIRSWLPMAKP